MHVDVPHLPALDLEPAVPGATRSQPVITGMVNVPIGLILGVLGY